MKPASQIEWSPADHDERYLVPKATWRRLLKQCKELGITEAQIFASFDVTSPDRSWARLSHLCSALSELAGPDRVTDIFMPDAGVSPATDLIASTFIDPASYIIATASLVHSAWPMCTMRTVRISRSRIRLIAAVEPSLSPSFQFGAVSIGACSSMSTHLGQSPGRSDATLEPREFVIVTDYGRPKTLYARLTQPRLVAVVEVLDRLLRRTLDFGPAPTPADQSVAALDGLRGVAHDTRLDRLLDAVLRLLRDVVGCTFVRIFLRRDGTIHQALEWGTRAEVQHYRALEVAHDMFGRLVFCGDDQTRALVDIALPWLSLKLQQALSLHLSTPIDDASGLVHAVENVPSPAFVRPVELVEPANSLAARALALGAPASADSPTDLSFASDADEELTLRVERAAARWQLTGRQVDVLRELARGRSNAELARALKLSKPTVATHVSDILRRSRTDSRAAVIASMWRD